MTPLILGLIGAFVIWSMRDDDVETWGGIEWRRWLWMFLSGVLAFAAVTISSPDPAALRTIIGGMTGVAIMGYWSLGHGPMLDGPQQLVVDDDDLIHRTCRSLWSKRIGDTMGWGFWLTYATIRYVLPAGIISGIAWKIEPLFAGAFIVIGYWPLAYVLSPLIKQNTKFIGAGLAGFFMYAALAT